MRRARCPTFNLRPTPAQERVPILRRPRVEVGALATACALLSPPGEASANDLSYRSYPLGGRAVGLGGAFTGLGNDPSGLYYNPAGLVDVSRGSVQVGTNLYGIEAQGGIAEAFGAVVDVERVVSELDIIPVTASGVSVIERDEDERPVTAYSIGSFVPASRSSLTSVINDLAPEERFPGCARLAYERTLSDRRFLFGAGVGHRIERRWSVGFAAFLAYRALREREEIACSEPSSGPSGPAFSTADTRLSLSVFSIQLAFAVKHQIDERWSIGATLVTPSIRAFGAAGVRVRQSSSLPAEGRTEFLLQEVEDVRAETREGLAVRVGVARVWDQRATLALDLSVHAPTSYRLVDIPPDRASVLEALTLTNAVERRAVVNAALGGEYLFVREFSLAAGIFTNFASTPTIPGEAGDGFEADRLAHVNEVGATLVGGVFSEHNLTRAGLVLTYGAGSDVVPRYAGLAAVGGRNQYVKVDLQQAALYFFLSTTVRY